MPENSTSKPLASSCSLDPSWVTWKPRFVRLRSRDPLSVIKNAAIRIGADRVVVDSGPILGVAVNGSPVALAVNSPMALSGGGAIVRKTRPSGRDSLELRWPDGSQLRISEWTTSQSYLNLFPTVVGVRRDTMEGLLGNANGATGDDFRLRNGAQVTDADVHGTFAASWRVQQAEALFDYSAGEDTNTSTDLSVPESEFTAADLSPSIRSAAEGECMAGGISAEPMLSDCVLDVALLGDGAVGAALEAQSAISTVHTAVPPRSNIWEAGRSRKSRS